MGDFMIQIIVVALCLFTSCCQLVEADPMHKQVAVTVKNSECNHDRLKTYVDNLESRLKKFWKPVSGTKYSVTVSFAIHQGGEMSELRLEESSKNALADQSALKCVEESSDFQAPPKQCGKKIIFNAKFEHE